jgi:RHS repeat-associated protein
MLRAHDLEPAPPSLAVTAWASKLASGVEDWSSNSNFRLVSDLSQELHRDHRDLDYMHARHSSPLTGRFLSTDKAGAWTAQSPQTWNRYSYARGNPARLVERNGSEESEAKVSEKPPSTSAFEMIKNTLRGVGMNAHPPVVYMNGEMKSAAPDSEALEKGVRLIDLGDRMLSLGQKIQKQSGKRGWSDEKIKDTVKAPARTEASKDTRHNQDGTRNNEPATIYYAKDGGYVVVNDRTGDVVLDGWNALWDLHLESAPFLPELLLPEILPPGASSGSEGE